MAELPTRLPNRQSTRSSAGSDVWFCELEGERYGPMDFRELRDLAIAKRLTEESPVWRETDGERKVAASIVGLLPKQKPKPAESPIPDSKVSDNDPYATPRARTIADGPPGGLYLPHLRRANFALFLGSLALSVVFFIAGSLIENPDTQLTIFALGMMAVVYCIVVSMVHLHRAWDMMHMFGAHLTGTKAVRFWIFPFFNALWAFVSLYGWSKLWNQTQKTHPGLSLASSVWRPVFFAFPILFLVSQGLLLMHYLTHDWLLQITEMRHQISLTVFTITLLVGVFCWRQMTHAINFLAKKKS